MTPTSPVRALDPPLVHPRRRSDASGGAAAVVARGRALAPRPVARRPLGPLARPSTVGGRRLGWQQPTAVVGSPALRRDSPRVRLPRRAARDAGRLDRR